MKQKPPVAFSIRYRDPKFPDDTTAADWDWMYEKQWARSASNGVRWQEVHGIDTFAHRAILECFGLGDWAEEFSIDRVFRMSPAELARARRAKEELLNLPKHEIRNHTLGGEKIPPEAYEKGEP